MSRSCTTGSVFVNAPAGVSAGFGRNKPTVDDEGAPVTANQRRFAKRSIGLAGAVTWLPTEFELGSSGRLFASGPGTDGEALLVGDSPQAGTTYVYSYEIATDQFSQVSSTPWSELPDVGGTLNRTYRPQGACVWYNLIVLYARRDENGIAKGISLFYSQDAGDNWTLVPNGHVPPNSAAAGADSGISRGREWAAPKPFPKDGINSAGEFSKDAVYFPWTDYLIPGGPVAKGYQVGLFRADRPDENSAWTVQPNRVIAERWEPLISSNRLHGHTAHTVTGGVVVWYGDVSNNNGADFISIDLGDYQTDPINVLQHWHGGVAPGQAHARNSLQPSSAVPGPSNRTLLAADTYYEPVLRLEDATASDVPPKLTPVTYVVNDARSGPITYEGWETFVLQWYPDVGWLSGGYDTDTFEFFGVPGVGDPMRHFSPDGETFATLNNTDPLVLPAYLLDATTIAALGSPTPGTRTILLADMPVFRSLRPLKLEEGANNRMRSPPVELVPPTAPNETKVAVWNNVQLRFEYQDGTHVENAPDKPAPLASPQYYVLETKSLASENHGWWRIGAGNSNLRVDQPVYAPVYVASLTPELSLRFVTSVGIGEAPNARTPQQGYKPGCNQGWFACPHFGTAAAPALTNPGQGQMQFLAGTGVTADQKPNYGNIMVAVGGIYNSATPVWPTEQNSTGNPDENETISGLPMPTTSGWTVAVTMFRPQLSRSMTDLATEGVLFRAVRDSTHRVIVKWKPQTLEIEITSVNGAATNVINLPFGHWFRTQPMTVIIADNGTKLEASALSPRFGVVTGVDADGTMGMGMWPEFISMYEPNKVFGLEVGGIAYKRDFLDENARKASLKNLEFLVHQ